MTDTMRKIIHVDMDAFFASVEQRDNPELIGKPVVVGGIPNSRGVVCTCSYEARKFGIHSAMPCSQAYRLCPQAIFVPVRMNVYKEASAVIRKIFYEFTDLVEPLSLDEAFLDVTLNKQGIPSATIIAQQILQKIQEATHLTASAGVSFNKFLAKCASDYRKPNGLTVIVPGDEIAFLDNLSIRKFFGVGKVTEKKMIAMGIESGCDLRKYDKVALVQAFGNSGSYFYDIARGVDNRPVRIDRTRKSIGRETTMKEDILDSVYLMEVLRRLAAEVVNTCIKQNKKGYSVTLKVKYSDFKSITRSKLVERPVRETKDIVDAVKELIVKTEVGERPVRLVGVSVSRFDEEDLNIGPVQLTFDF